MKVIVLDRDGVINQDSRDFIKNPDEWHPILGSLEAIAKLNNLGYQVVVATNQSGLARGYFTQSDLDAIHKKMADQLEKVGGHLDGIFICPHGPDDGCNCRKPKPGLFLEIAEYFAVSPSEIIAIGDSMRDLLAAKAAGCFPILVKTGNGEATLATHDRVLNDILVFEDLAAAVENIFVAKP